jgi:hypothetical protein
LTQIGIAVTGGAIIWLGEVNYPAAGYRVVVTDQIGFGLSEEQREHRVPRRPTTRRTSSQVRHP